MHILYFLFFAKEENYAHVDELARALAAGELGNLYDDALRLELQTIQYEIFSDRTLRIVSKDAIKKLLGKSPDLADSLAYANWVRTFRGEFLLDMYPYLVEGKMVLC